ncbi:AfsR/SARP family transcriptional regulator [Streptomyces cucumeris]|uniref:AfsR/SARP family transcriptional regulator n=1 Tax=Streptomyces cucumeris TaxID=2962890 RepID=UPI003D707483
MSTTASRSETGIKGDFMELKILGPVRLTVSGRTLRIGSFKQRTLLAQLACANGSAVSVERLMDTLWQDTPPPSAGKNLQVYVWHLRKVLGRYNAADRLEHAPPGYRLALRPDELDLASFERRVASARRQRTRGDLRGALAEFRTALAGWREEALADVLSVPALYAESVHLEELRLSAVEEYLDTALALGEYAEVIAAVDTPLRTHPFRERLWMARILALYLSGRQSDALAAYHRLRNRLGEELGLEPSKQLQELQQLVLSGSPLTEAALVLRLR